MQTLAPIRKRSTRIELNKRELIMVDSFLFDGLVRMMQDGKSFDYENPEDDHFRMEHGAEMDAIRAIQRKIQFAMKQIEIDAAAG